MVTDFSFQIVAVVFAVVFGVIVWVLVSTSAKRRRQAPINTQQVQWQAQGELLQRTNGTGAFTVTRGNIVVIFLYVMAVFALGMGGTLSYFLVLDGGTMTAGIKAAMIGLVVVFVAGAVAIAYAARGASRFRIDVSGDMLVFASGLRPPRQSRAADIASVISAGGKGAYIEGRAGDGSRLFISQVSDVNFSALVDWLMVMRPDLTVNKGWTR